MKKYLFAGIITLLPLTLTIMIIVYLFDLLTDPFAGIIEKFLPTNETTILFLSRIIVLIILFFLILVLGMFAQKYFFDSLMRFLHKITLRIPLVGTLYRLTKDITKAFFSQGQTFKKTVLVPFPHHDTYTLGLVTGDVPPIFKQHLPQVSVSVFVPTAPHPISGFILLAPDSLLTDVAIPSEEVFKFLLSCGVIHPGQLTKPVQD